MDERFGELFKLDGMIVNTIIYAQKELKKYWKLVTGGGDCRIRLVNENYGGPFDDVIDIDVKEGAGEIRGSSERAVLIGVYRFFYLLGCRFLRPGKDGEIIVKKPASACGAKGRFTPENRHRGIHAEGALSVENITDMIEWLPKIGMNSYFMPFKDGHWLFERWYTHKDSSVLKAEAYTAADSKRHYETVVKAVKKRGLIFHAAGHGWTTEPLGYFTFGQRPAAESDIKPEHRELFALVGGKRGFYGSPGDTQLCYGNPKARNIITDAIAGYLAKNKRVDILHFWLADNINNHCECEKCRDTLPSDFYVMMLNELDAKLAAKKIDTKIAFLIYCDLLWAPETQRIANPGRFLLMYAPICRDFFRPMYTDKNFADSKTGGVPPYVRNKVQHPQKNAHFLYYLNEWLQTVKCDSFSFDYHLTAFQYGADLSFRTVSRTIYEDMRDLKKAGLNGNISCQQQRIFFPTSLPDYVMGRMLFGSSESFSDIEDEYLSASFGGQKETVSGLLRDVEKFFLSDTMLAKENADASGGWFDRWAALFSDYRKKIKFSGRGRTVRLSLSLIGYLLDILDRLIKIKKAKRGGEDVEEPVKALFGFIDENETRYQRHVDALWFKPALRAWV